MEPLNEFYPPQFAELPNGERIAYREFGSGEDTILHIGDLGFSSLWTLAFYQAQQPADRFRFVAVDIRSTGLSSYNTPVKSIVQLANDVKSTLDFLGHDRVHAIFGQLYGCTIAITLAALYPTITSSLVLLNPLLYSPKLWKVPPSPQKKDTMIDDSALKWTPTFEQIEKLQRVILKDDHSSDFINGLKGTFGPHFQQAMEECLNTRDYRSHVNLVYYTDLEEAVKSIKVPTLIVTSKKSDSNGEKAAATLKDTIKTSELLVEDHQSNFLQEHLTDVQAFTVKMIDWLDKQLFRQDLPNGEQLAYKRYGYGTQPVILLHSWLGSNEYYKPFVTELMKKTKKYRIYALDLRGSGNSTFNNALTSFDDFGEDIELFMEVKGIKKAYFIGATMGGAIGLKFAINHPELCGKLLLANSIPIYGLHSAPSCDNPEEALKKYEALKYDIATRNFEKIRQGTCKAYEAISDKFADTMTNVAFTVRHYAQTYDFMLTFNVADQLSKIKCPVYVIQGTNDPVSKPKMGEEAHQKLGDKSKLKLLEGKGHHLLADSIPELVDITLEFF